MQTGSSETLIGRKSGKTTYVPLWDRMEGAWQWTLDSTVGTALSQKLLEFLKALSQNYQKAKDLGTRPIKCEQLLNMKNPALDLECMHPPTNMYCIFLIRFKKFIKKYF